MKKDENSIYQQKALKFLGFKEWKSIAVHEICHAVHMHFKTLGLDINDDEHMALVQGNVFECFLRNFYEEV